MATGNWAQICLKMHIKLQFCKRMGKILRLTEFSWDALCVVWWWLCSLLVGMGHFSEVKHVTEQDPSAQGLSFLLMVGLLSLGIPAKAMLQIPSCQDLCTCSTDGAPEVFNMTVKWRAMVECRKFLDPMEVCMLFMVSRFVDAFNSFHRVCCCTLGRTFWC